ncbi:MAG: hypothetical protein ACYDAY_08720 [Candidatus Dormibacteria bacterium]
MPFLVLALGLAAACTPGGAATNMGGQVSVTVTASTNTFIWTLNTGPTEPMYTIDQVNAQHPTTGEMMVTGPLMSPDTMAGMDMSGQRHLEIHIKDRLNHPITNVAPTVLVVDSTANKTSPLTVVVMRGVTATAADDHFGNNVVLTSGHQYDIQATLFGETAHFHLVG